MQGILTVEAPLLPSPCCMIHPGRWVKNSTQRQPLGGFPNPFPFPHNLRVLVVQSCPTLYDPGDYSPPGYPVHGIFQPRYWIWVSCVAGWFFTIWATKESHILQVFNFFQHALSNKQGQSSLSKIWLSSVCVMQGRLFLEVYQKRNFKRGTLGWYDVKLLELGGVRADGRVQSKTRREFPGGPVVKNPPANAGDTRSIPGLGRFHSHGGTKPIRCDYWAHTAGAHALQLEQSQ